jgi:hypothetical protein
MDRLRDGGEAVSRGGEFVVVGQERGGREHAAGIRGDGANCACAQRFEADCGFGDRERLRVGYFSGNDSVVALSDDGGRKDQDPEKKASHVPTK